MEYSIEMSRGAVRSLKGLPKRIQRQVSRKIDALKTDPHPPKSVKLDDNVYRIRSGDCRMIYSVFEQKVLVCVLAIGDRKDIYKRLVR